MKKLGIAALVVFVAIVLVFSLFTFVKCEKETAKNYLSQLHMIIGPIEEKNPDWNSIKSAIKNRCGRLCEFRFFEVYDDKAVLEVTGARDPNMMASMLIMKGDAKLLDGNGQKIATDKEVQIAGLMSPQNQTTDSAIFGVQIDQTASERLKARISGLKDGQKLTVSLYVDDVKVLTTQIGKSDQQDLIVFKAEKETEAQLLDYLGQAITYKLPYTIGVDKYGSFFIPPLSEKSALIDFQDILGKIVINEQK